jgi:glutamate-1-semialdehyde 2,1-aminomutase
MANGYPIAAVGGKASIMNLISGFDGVLHGGTFTGHPIALAAAQETLRILRDTDVLRQVADWGNELQEQLSRVFADHDVPHVFTGHPSMFGIMFREEQPASYRDWVTSDHDLYDRMARALPDFGILPEPDSREPWFICEIASVARPQRHRRHGVRRSDGTRALVERVRPRRNRRHS